MLHQRAWAFSYRKWATYVEKSDNYIFLNFFKNPHQRVHLLIFREREGWGWGKRETSIDCLHHKPQLWIEPAVFWCTERYFNQLNHPAREIIFWYRKTSVTLVCAMNWKGLTLNKFKPVVVKKSVRHKIRTKNGNRGHQEDGLPKI